MITSRILDYEGWPKLEAFGLNWAELDPDRVLIVVIERDGEIIGYWPLAWPLHANGVCIREDERCNPAVVCALVEAMKAHARTRVPAVLISSVEDPQIEDFVERLGGVKVPGHEYRMAV